MLFVLTGCKNKKPKLEETEELFSYNLLEDDTYEIFGNQTIEYKAAVRKIEIPTTYKGKDVTTIGYQAFSGYGALKEVTIPEGIMYINAEAFWDCADLEEVVLPATLSWLFVDAFLGCNKLKSFEVKEGNVAFSSMDGILYNKEQTALVRCPEGKKMEKFFVPEEIELIDVNAFTGCDNVNEIYIGPNVISIVINDFWGCWECRGVFVVGEHAFWQASNLVNINVDPGNESYKSHDGILYSKDMRELIVCPAGKTGEIVIPEGVEMVGMGAFASCDKIVNIIFPSTLSHITPNAFWDCDSLTKVTFDKENEMFKYSDGVIYKEGNKLDLCLEDKEGDFIIPDTVTYISGYSFYNKNKLNNVYIPESVVEVEDWAFSSCDNLTIKVYHETRPGSWNEGWNPDEIEVVWNYKNS